MYEGILASKLTVPVVSTLLLLNEIVDVPVVGVTTCSSCWFVPSPVWPWPSSVWPVPSPVWLLTKFDLYEAIKLAKFSSIA